MFGGMIGLPTSNWDVSNGINMTGIMSIDTYVLTQTSLLVLLIFKIGYRCIINMKITGN